MPKAVLYLRTILQHQPWNQRYTLTGYLVHQLHVMLVCCCLSLVFVFCMAEGLKRLLCLAATSKWKISQLLDQTPLSVSFGVPFNCCVASQVVKHGWETATYCKRRQTSKLLLLSTLNRAKGTECMNSKETKWLSCGCVQAQYWLIQGDIAWFLLSGYLNPLLFSW